MRGHRSAAWQSATSATWFWRKTFIYVTAATIFQVPTYPRGRHSTQDATWRYVWSLWVVVGVYVWVCR